MIFAATAPASKSVSGSRLLLISPCVRTRLAATLLVEFLRGSRTRMVVALRQTCSPSFDAPHLHYLEARTMLLMTQQHRSRRHYPLHPFMRQPNAFLRQRGRDRP